MFHISAGRRKIRPVTGRSGVKEEAKMQVHGALKADCYDAFRAARQDAVEAQGGFDARA